MFKKTRILSLCKKYNTLNEYVKNVSMNGGNLYNIVNGGRREYIYNVLLKQIEIEIERLMKRLR